MHSKIFYMFAVGLAMALAGCSDSTAPAAKKPTIEPVTGETALWRMYQVARTWAPDAQVLKLATMPMAEVPAPPGKAGAWQATFTSVSGGRARPYTYSVVDVEPTLHKGVFAGTEEAWTAPEDDSGPFLIAAVKTDSDAAYQTALKEGGAEYNKKNPGKPITFLLEKAPKYANPAWRVIWGQSPSLSDFSVYVDAMTGKFLERMH
jgi:hypothetical protein